MGVGRSGESCMVDALCSGTGETAGQCVMRDN